MPVLIFLMWILLNGRVTAELVIFGIAISAAVSLFAYKVTGYAPANDRRIFRNLPLLLLYALNLVWEILKASFLVMGVAARREQPDPVIVEFDSGFESDLQNVLLANSITLTPGTITLFQEKDHFVIHCLKPEYAEGMEDSSFVRLLRKLH